MQKLPVLKKTNKESPRFTFTKILQEEQEEMPDKKRKDAPKPRPGFQGWLIGGLLALVIGLTVFSNDSGAVTIPPIVHLRKWSDQMMCKKWCSSKIKISLK